MNMDLIVVMSIYVKNLVKIVIFIAKNIMKLISVNVKTHQVRITIVKCMITLVVIMYARTKKIGV